MNNPGGIRLNKYLASCGVGSRRHCDSLIFKGSVQVNGVPCLNPATRIVQHDSVKVDGKLVQPKDESTIIFYKPRGIVCTKSDELERDTIYSILPGSLQHLNHVGRLDRESEGLLILTNDGELSQSLLHPSSLIQKEYLVTANQPYQDEHLDLLLSGVYVENGKKKLTAASVERISARRILVVLTTGYKRQIREMLGSLGYRVQRLVRLRIGSLSLGALRPGEWLPLDPKGIDALTRNPRVARPKSRKSSRPRQTSKTNRREKEK